MYIIQSCLNPFCSLFHLEPVFLTHSLKTKWSSSKTNITPLSLLSLNNILFIYFSINHSRRKITWKRVSIQLIWSLTASISRILTDDSWKGNNSLPCTHKATLIAQNDIFLKNYSVSPKKCEIGNITFELMATHRCVRSRIGFFWCWTLDYWQVSNMCPSCVYTSMCMCKLVKEQNLGHPVELWVNFDH